MWHPSSGETRTLLGGPSAPPPLMKFSTGNGVEMARNLNRARPSVAPERTKVRFLSLAFETEGDARLFRARCVLTPPSSSKALKS